MLENVPVGAYGLRVSAPGWVPLHVEGVEVVEGRVTDVGTLALSAGATAVGRLRAPAELRGRAGKVALRRLDARDHLGYVVADADPDGTFRATGLGAGAYEVALSVQGAEARGPWTSLVPTKGERLVVGSPEGEVTFEADVVPGGLVIVRASDPRLPPGPDSEERTKPEQLAFGARARLTVRSAGGDLVADVSPVSRSMTYGGQLRVVPGRYVARLELPGGEVLEESTEVAAGATVHVMLRAR
jgi:hypothetical protein